jgi:hypothetical protein
VKREITQRLDRHRNMINKQRRQSSWWFKLAVCIRYPLHRDNRVHHVIELSDLKNVGIM